MHFYPQCFPSDQRCQWIRWAALDSQWFEQTQIWTQTILTHYTQIFNGLKTVNRQPLTLNPIMLKTNTWGLSWTEALLNTHIQSLSSTFVWHDSVVCCINGNSNCFTIHVYWGSILPYSNIITVSPNCSLIGSAQSYSSWHPFKPSGSETPMSNVSRGSNEEVGAVWKFF